MTCPMCERGEIVHGICNRCEVGVAQGSQTPIPDKRHRWTNFKDQDYVGGQTDIARYKQDHAE